MISPAIPASANPTTSDVPPRRGGASSSLGRLLLRGGLALGLAVGLERGLNFLANMLAARAAGPEIFGTYSIALVTASTIATYTGAGIGATANRFSGQFPRESRHYSGLLRALIIISVSSAFLASALLFAGAEPLARLLLRNEELAPLLRLSAFSAAAMILLECCRGLLIGQHKFPAMLVLSAISGTGLLLILPSAASRGGAAAMITGQALVGLIAVGVCVLFSSQLGVAPIKSVRLEESTADGPKVRSVFTFGLAQLGAVIGLNIAGWWLTSLVARADATLFQMGLYAVANQFRQLATIFPDLLARICYPLLTKESGQKYGGADHVMLINTYVVTAIAVAVAGAVTIILPWLLPLLYGETYIAGEAPCALLLATAVVHMSGAPAANRLNILNLRAASVINAVWAVLLISLGAVLVPRAGVTGAATTFLFAHIVSACLVLGALSRWDALPRGMLALSVVGIASAVTLGGAAYARTVATFVNYGLMMSIAMTTLTMVTLAALAYFGRSNGWLPGDFGFAGVREFATLRWAGKK